MLKTIYENLPSNATIAYSAVTGYGEHLIKAALSFDKGEVETIAHYTAAELPAWRGDHSGYRWPGYEMPEDKKWCYREHYVE